MTTGRGPTYRRLLQSVSTRLRRGGVPEPEVDARLLIRHSAGLSAERFLSSLTDVVPPGAVEQLEGLVRRREQREPLQHITGKAWFYGREFTVDGRVLIPRPETEQLVEQALEFVRRRGLEAPRVVDIGAGSGAVAVTLALELPRAEVWGTDVDERALEVARQNAASLGGSVRLVSGDLFGPLKGRFDVIVSNPPYIRTSVLSTLEPELAWEPRGALDGGPDGLGVIRPLLASLHAFLGKDAALAALEIDPPIAGEAVRLAREGVPGARVDVLTDLAGLERVLVVERG